MRGFSIIIVLAVLHWGGLVDKLAAEPNHEQRPNPSPDAQGSGNRPQNNPNTAQSWSPSRLRALEFCYNPYSICKRFRPSRQGKPPFVPRSFFPQQSPQIARQGGQYLINFFNSTLKPAMLHAIWNSPGLTQNERNRAYHAVGALRLEIISDAMRCGGHNTINAMNMVGMGRIAVCVGMLYNAIQNTVETRHSFENFLAHVLGHEIGHSISQAIGSRVNGILSNCLATIRSTRPASSAELEEKRSDFWGNQMVVELTKGWYGNPAAMADFLEDTFSNFCVFPTNGYAGHPPIADRIASARYSNIAWLADCPPQLDRSAICTTAGPTYRRTTY